MTSTHKAPIARRFRGFLPVVVDIETGGFNAETDAVLEVAAAIIKMSPEGLFEIKSTHGFHVKPFEGANIEEASLKITGIDPFHPLRPAIDEEDALRMIFREVRAEQKATGCSRAILVGHNAWFDLKFINAAAERCGIKKNPFHPFSSFDTATMGGMLYGQTVLSRIAIAAGQSWDENAAHSARYDTERTADLFCKMMNQCHDMYHQNVPQT